MRSISRIASCLAYTAPTIAVSAAALSDKLAIEWWLRLVNVHMYDSISNVYYTASSTLFGRHCLTANATSAYPLVLDIGQGKAVHLPCLPDLEMLCLP